MENSKEGSPNTDEDLAALLDSCLDDFKNAVPEKAPATESKEPSLGPGQTTSIPKPTNASDSEKLTEAWGEEFKQFTSVMENFLDDQPEMAEIKNWMGELGKTHAPPQSEDFAKSFADTLKQLTQEAGNIPDPTPEDFANMLGEGVGDNENFSDMMSMMQNVMQTLMSKELLYPSIKEIVEKYPEWMDQQKDVLTKEELGKYKQQHELMMKVCEEFQKEGVASDEAKKEQFEKVLVLMQKIQSCGSPPKEILSAVGENVPLDEFGNLQLPGMPSGMTEQCAMM